MDNSESEFLLEVVKTKFKKLKRHMGFIYLQLHQQDCFSNHTHGNEKTESVSGSKSLKLERE